MGSSPVGATKEEIMRRMKLEFTEEMLEDLKNGKGFEEIYEKELEKVVKIDGQWQIVNTEKLSLNFLTSGQRLQNENKKHNTSPEGSGTI